MRLLHTALQTAVRRLAHGSQTALAVAAAVLAVAAARPAAAQCPPNLCDSACQSLWLGDLNNDNAVDGFDLELFQRCFLPDPTNPVPIYCECADFNFDGQLDDVDLSYLVRIVEMANSASIRKLPRVQLSEMRVRKPTTQTNPAIPDSRFVEIRTPISAASLTTTTPPSQIQAPTVNGVIPGNEDVRVFQAGWYYIKVARSVETANPASSVTGTIAVAVPLAGMTWVSNPLFTTTRGLGVMIDPSWVGSPLVPRVPLQVQPYLYDISPSSLAFPAPGLLTFNNETSTNVTHLIVFRNPAGPREIPAVGQRINMSVQQNPAAKCDIAWLVPGTPEKLPPWDAVVDCVTIVRGLDYENFGCIFGGSAGFRIGPVSGVGFNYAPPHVYRCRNAGTWTRGADAVTGTSDSPFTRNPTCVTVVQGCGEPAVDGSVRDCFEAQSDAGCSDSDCCLAVCQLDPACCSVAWDASCAAQAKITCTQCGLNPASCFIAHPTPACGDPNCCQQVCNVDPSCCDVSWDDSCVHWAAKLCLSCGAASSDSCLTPHALPYCLDPECCNAVCNVDPFCCNVTWDQGCVDNAGSLCSGCGAVNTGDCCIVHATPYCSDETCCAAVCAVDPFCCNSAWDLGCTQLTLVYCGGLNCTCGIGDSCFTPHRDPGCVNSLCCQTVCLHDPFCCFVTWDTQCTRVAGDLCSNNPGCTDPGTGLPVLGSCYLPHLTPGCDQPGCCGQVCANPAYAYCCTLEWDVQCATLAGQICDQCGDPLSGGCFAEHGTPNCANKVCCTKVCNQDPFCCDSVWDGLCVQLAIANCPPPGSACGGTNTRSCFIPNYTPGCSDSSCCLVICNTIDPFCCESRWDAVCAREAALFCAVHFVVTVTPGGCLTPHPSRGCADKDCARAVCSVDTLCCTVAWDAHCVSIAAAVCVAPGSCPAAGDCQLVHLNPGCNDAACCSGVCAADPTCCDGTWDGGCVALARQLCKTPLGEQWPCPCRGECTEFHSNPGCTDASCCNIVCHVDPTCCTETWDWPCVEAARSFCCGPIGCGSGCNGPCLVPHAEPYCNDPYCCDAVCRVDPLCCSFSWDSLCAAGAYERCAGACGIATAGNCFIEHELGGCRDGQCCAAVCHVDPLCCTSSWDSTCVQIASMPQHASVCKRTVCGNATAGDCCTPHDTQGCKKAACCTAVCALDPFCCETQWDANCTDEARKVPSCDCTFECGDTCAGDCCRAHNNNGCDDADCCAAVCLQDSYCCQVEWDTVCASMARATCTGRNDACPVPPCGSPLLTSCCVPGILPHCSNEQCCNAICAIDPFCCDIQWDISCAQRARSEPFLAICDCESGGCGDTSAGSCFTEHTEPFCSDAGCCQTVCAFDPTCCTVAWDANCVSVAQFFCGGQFAPLLDAFNNGGKGMPRTVRVPPTGWTPPRQRAVPRPKVDLPPSYPKALPPGTDRADPATGKVLETAPAPTTKLKGSK